MRALSKDFFHLGSLLRKRHARSPIGTRNAVRTRGSTGACSVIRTHSTTGTCSAAETRSAIGIRTHSATGTRSAIGIRTCSAIGARDTIRTRNAAGIRNAISSRAKRNGPGILPRPLSRNDLAGYAPCRRSSTIAARVAESLSTSCRILLDYPIHAPSDANRYHVPSILCQPVAMRPEPLK